MSRRTLIVVGSIVVGLIAIVTFMVLSDISLAPGSHPYRPVSAQEASFLKKARRDIYPDDVRKHPTRHIKALVVWTGFIRRLRVEDEKGLKLLRFEVEHRYFDWIEDRGIQTERHFLSRRGEGRFHSTWSVSPAAWARAKGHIREGDMLVVYGYPSTHGREVGLSTAYVRPIAAKWVRDDTLDYGRRPRARRARRMEMGR